MTDQKKEQTATFVYGSEFSVGYVWLIPIGLVVSLAIIFAHGVSVFDGPSYFLMAYFFQNGSQYTVDPVITTFVKHSTPFLLKVFAPVIDIPFYHLVVGVITKVFLVFIFYMLAWKMTRSSLASLISVFILFGVADFHVGEYHILNLRLPIGFTSNELRMPLYLSFRQVGTIFSLGATLFFLNKKFLLSSIFLAFGVYFHPLNLLGFFLCFNLALLICSLKKGNRIVFFYAIIKLSVPFLVIILPYVYKSAGVLTDVSPMSFSSYWDFFLKNEPDDASTIWYFQHYKSLYLVGFFLTVIAATSHIFLKIKKPVQLRNFWQFDFEDLVVPLLAAPWILLFFSLVWEMALIPLFPDFLNDIISILNLKRITTVSGIVYIPILSMLVSAIVILISRTAYREIFAEKQRNKWKKFFKKIGLVSLEHIISFGASIFILCYVLYLDNRQIQTFNKFFNFDHVEFDYFLEDEVPSSLPQNMGNGAWTTPVESLIAACDWVKNNTPVEAALIHPTYIKRVRVYCKRQAFLSEKEDGNFSLVNRKFATLYLQRFFDIHTGLTYDDMPGTVFEGGAGYSVMRTRYLSLRENDIQNLRVKYPGYDYFMTETSHALDYPILFENDFFRLYDIR